MDYEQQEKHNSFFERIAIRNLDGEVKSTTAKNIIQDVETGIEYRSQMILACVIATLGLLINATPVVIGAMLIAPILRPIQAVSFGITTGNRRLFLKGFFLLISSIFIGIICAVVITRLIPLSELTSEILMRTKPTLIDLGIAFASGIIAFLAFGYEKITASIAGVAMAASLVPPLAVIGIGIGMAQRSVATSSSILFLTNLVAIILAGVVIFFLFGFRPNQKRELKTSIITSGFSIIMMVVLSIPLASSLVSIIDGINERKTIDEVVTNYINTIDPTIDFEGFTQKDSIISLKLRAPESVNFQTQQKNKLTQLLAQALEQEVNVDITITPFINADSFSAAAILLPIDRINTSIDRFLSILYPTISRLDTQLITTHQNILVVEFYTEEQFDRERFKLQLEEYLAESRHTVDTLIIRRHTSLQEDTPAVTALPSSTSVNNESERNRLRNTLERSFIQEIPETNLVEFTILRGESSNEVIIIAGVLTTLSPEALQSSVSQRQASAEALAQLSVSITLTAQYGERVIIE